MEYKNRKTTRLQNFNYSQSGMYFVTICAKDREELFGEIKNGVMILNDVGEIAQACYLEIPKNFRNVYLDEFCIMPNHIHGILEIINNDLNVGNAHVRSKEYNQSNVGTRFIASKNNNTSYINRKDAINRVPTKGGITGKHNPSLNPNSVSSIVKWSKGRCTFEIRKKLNPIYFAWQSRFYDRIIRNGIELNKIREYIFKNPANWEQDRNNPENLMM